MLRRRAGHLRARAPRKNYYLLTYHCECSEATETYQGRVDFLPEWAKKPFKEFSGQVVYGEKEPSFKASCGCEYGVFGSIARMHRDGKLKVEKITNAGAVFSVTFMNRCDCDGAERDDEQREQTDYVDGID